MNEDEPGAGWVTWTGMAVVLIAAAVLSFSALRELAVAVRISPTLAWLLPIAVDAGAAVSCRTWLARRAPKDAERFAQRLTWGLLALTVLGNATSQGMTANGVTPPWWVAVVVGAVPPAVVGSVIHLAVLVGRHTPEPVDEADQEDEALEDPDPLLADLLDLMATSEKPVGRGTVMKELGVNEYRAKQLLKAVAS